MCDVKCYIYVSIILYIYDDDDKIAEEKKNGGDVVPSKECTIMHSSIIYIYISASTYFVWYKQVLD